VFGPVVACLRYAQALPRDNFSDNDFGNICEAVA
jgi:hypothetical protein